MSVFSETFEAPPAPVSKKEFVIAGIVTRVFGIDELPETRELACLWLLHPRLSEQESMEPIAAAAIAAWKQRSRQIGSQQGLICVSFDQRNHGSRKVDDLANQDWRHGNPRHAQDMFSIFQGTATDTSLLITYLPAYLPFTNNAEITSHLVLGVSLGGYAAWHCILHDHRITTAVPMIGSTDYVRVMSHRADKSKLQTWHTSDPPGLSFLGSQDFPKALQEAVNRWDPAGLFMNEKISSDNDNQEQDLSERERKRLMPLMRDHLKGKRIFNIAGGADKLVPYACSIPFLTWLKAAIRPGGWYSGYDVVLKDKAYDGAGHEITSDMMKDALDFIVDSLAQPNATAAKI